MLACIADLRPTMDATQQAWLNMEGLRSITSERFVPADVSKLQAKVGMQRAAFWCGP